ncbi:MAG: hypothetical protein KIS63_19810, partial [Caldilineales bacterium]|nr:hypothetical protein [Caldilineales bacterium]
LPARNQHHQGHRRGEESTVVRDDRFLTRTDFGDTPSPFSLEPPHSPLRRFLFGPRKPKPRLAGGSAGVLVEEEERSLRRNHRLGYITLLQLSSYSINLKGA